ncbi:hypothetical protein B0T16DRAFT_450265 [Cercophora newfieldiana]|uniref:Uncharacterized protein n=1 Tax=Cercophora newfieldiana TaxID=92897 RepID=A0AA39XSU0_9PEZI|nr:hypothetical protein B0T16DRAFT_450265 [Cercophora newfieldiana]
MAFPTGGSDKTKLAREFIESRGPQIHNVFGVPSHFNTMTSRYEIEEVHKLRETLEFIERQSPELVDFDFDLKNCTWTDVLTELERAQEAAIKCGERGKKWYHRPWRAVGVYGGVVSPALSAFPDELSVLHGGLAVIMSIARHRETNRNKILHAFENLPNVIQMAQDKANTFPLDKKMESIRLHESVNELQQTLLRTLPDLIEKLNPGTFPTSAFKGVDIDHLLEAIHNSSEKVRICAEGIRDATIVDTHDTTMDGYVITKLIRTDTIKIDNKVDILHQKFAEVQESLQYYINAISGQNYLLQFLSESCRLPPFQPSPSPSPPVQTTRQQTHTIKPSDLFDFLNVHHLQTLHEQNHIIRKGSSSLDPLSISRAASLIQTSQFQSLLHSPQSGLLLVDGHTDRAQQTGRVSPLSYVCATLVHALQQQGNVAGMDDEDGLGGPQGLVRSLVSQLVLLLVGNRWMGEDQEVPVSMAPAAEPRVSLAELCEVFCWLLGLVPRGTSVFCLVDGISFYERDYWREDYEIVTGMFGRIVQDSGIGGFLKVLMTSPTASLELEMHGCVQLTGDLSSFGRHVQRKLCSLVNLNFIDL